MSDGSLTDVTNIDDEASLSIDIQSAENAAKRYDYNGRDLIIHVDYEFDKPTPMNFVVIDPVLYHTSSFIEVLDVATAAEGEEFITVDGFAEQSFDKILTPEANKIISDDVVKKTFAPSNFAYQGLGVFSFPLRIGTKLRATIMMRDPVPVLYERLHVLTQETVEATIQSHSEGKGL